MLDDSCRRQLPDSTRATAAPLPTVIGGRPFVIQACRPEHLTELARDLPVNLMGQVDAAAKRLCEDFAGVCLVGGRPAIACGILVHWRGHDARGRPCGYAEGWAKLAAEDAAVPLKAWPAITAACIAGLDRAQTDGIRLIEATVDIGFAAGHRWAARLGFRMACLRPAWGLGGRDGVLYQRVRGAC